MDRAQAQELRSRIVQKRAELQAMDKPIYYSKRDLKGGMQSRVKRKEDKAFKQNVARQRKVFGQKISEVNAYINRLAAYDAYRAELARRQVAESDGLIFAPLQSVSKPLVPKVTFFKTPDRNRSMKVRKRRQGIKVRGLR